VCERFRQDRQVRQTEQLYLQAWHAAHPAGAKQVASAPVEAGR
jgi:hypothetical protein